MNFEYLSYTIKRELNRPSMNKINKLDRENDLNLYWHKLVYYMHL